MDILRTIGTLAFTARFRRLSDRMTSEVLEIFDHEDLKFDLRFGPILVVLHRERTIVSTEISRALGYTRAAVSQTVSSMLKAGLVVEEIDPADRRRKMIRLTDKGQTLVRKLEPAWNRSTQVFKNLEDETGLDLLGYLERIEDSLDHISLYKRYCLKRAGISIVKHKSPDFSLDEIKRLFRAYQNDIGIQLDFQDFETELSELPGKYHPKKKGELYLVRLQNKFVGCAALKRLKPGVCELKRFYVDPSARGHGIGELLLKEVIQDGRRHGYDKIYLDSIARLKAARKLYEKLGFYEIQPYNNNPHSDVYYMEMNLAANVT